MRSNTSLTFYGGVDEIGGNKILLEDKDVKIFLDFGMSFSSKMKYYSPPFLSPRSEKSLQQLGILPQLDGIYKFDDDAPEVEAVFLSHAHMDHSAYISFIHREIPVFCGQTTKILLQALGEIRRTDLEFNVEGLTFRAFRTGNKITIGHLEIEPIHVDHSVPGAYGFVVHTSNGAIVYTGDFRAHGTKPEMTSDLVEKAEESKPVAIITEATNMTAASISSEVEVENKLHDIVGEASGLVLADFAYADVDRLNSFFRTANNVGRCLVVSLKQAYILKALREDKRLNVPDLNDANLLIFRRSKKKFLKWERQIIAEYKDKIVDVFEISKQQDKMVLAMSFYDLDELVEIKPKSGSCYVLSASEPYNEEMEIDYERMINWLSHFGLPQYHVHVSGHIMPLQLKRVLRQVGADKVFPIHTECSDLFSKFMKDLRSKTVLVEKGKRYGI